MTTTQPIVRQLGRTATADPGEAAPTRRPAYAIGCVDHALEVLAMLSTQPTLRVAEVAKHLGVASSTAHRLLAMLVYRDFVAQDRNSHVYRAGPVLIEKGLSALARVDLRRIGRPYLERIAHETGETATLLVLHGRSVRFVDGVDSPNQVRVSFHVGLARPAYSTSGGKALLAALPHETLLALFPDEQLPTLTDRTFMTRTQLLDELELVRQRGYGINSEESIEGLAAIGVAVFDVRGRPVAAVNVAAPTHRATPAMLGRALRSARSAARDLGAALYT